MKIYACPTDVPAPVVDYKNYDNAKVSADEAAHRLALTAHFRALGYTGSNTGRTVSFSVADGQAEYLIVEGPRSFLIHLPYGDAYQYRDAAFLPKREILRRADLNDRTRAFFAKAS